MDNGKSTCTDDRIRYEISRHIHSGRWPDAKHVTVKKDHLGWFVELFNCEYRVRVASACAHDSDYRNSVEDATCLLLADLDSGYRYYLSNQNAVAKHDAGKDRWDLLPIAAVRESVRVLTYGARKYDPEGWRSVSEPRRRYYAAAQRHLSAWWLGEPNDAESGLSHVAHAACCLLFLLELELEGEKKP